MMVTSIHCSLGAGDNWTDLVTNVTSIEPGQFGLNVRKWTELGTAPPEQLSVFIHEATHHWCFMSPVGNALSLLALRAQQRAFRIVEADGDEREELEALLDDLVRARVAVTFLRPLAEGLAGFAEFDAVSKMWSRTLSPLMRWVGILYADPEFVANGLRQRALPPEFVITAGLGGTICRLREASATLDRKASLLLDPFDPAAGGYLPGYLTVKSLWRTLGRHSTRALNETDLVLMYLRSYFYDDHGLVVALLDPAIRERHAAEAIINHINERLNRFPEMAEAGLDAYEDGLLRAEAGETPHPLPGIGIAKGDATRGWGLWDAGLHDLMAGADSPEGALLPWYRYLARVLARREFLNLGSIDAEVTVKADGQVVARDGDETLHEGKPVGTPTPGSGSGTLEVVFSMLEDSISRALVITRGSQVVSCDVFGPSQQVANTQQAVLGTFQERPRLVDIDRHARKAMDELVRASWIRWDLEHIAAQADARLGEFYKDAALRFARDYDAIDACAERMRERGLGPLLRTSRLVRGAALLGMACSLDPKRASIDGRFRAAGLDLEETLDGLGRSYAEYGFPPQVLVSEDSIFSTI